MFMVFKLRRNGQTNELGEPISSSDRNESVNKVTDDEKNNDLNFSVGVHSLIKMPDSSQIQMHSIAKSLESSLVAQLTNQVCRKLASSGLQALAGTTEMLDESAIAGTPGLAVLLYHHGDYLVCLLDASLQKLDAFHDQLCDHIVEQIPDLSKSAPDEAAESAAAAAAFGTWEDATVASLQRTVKLLRNVLPQLLTLVFVGCELTVDCPDADQQRRREIQRFVSQCRLLDAIEAGAMAAEVADEAAGVGQSEASLPPQPRFPRAACLRLNGRAVSLPDFPYYTEFAKTWSASLLDSLDDENPVRLQQRILDLKLQASRDVNATKRLLAEAVSDYYALYRLVQALRQTGNAPVLLHSLSSLGRPEEQEVVACVRDFLAASCPLLTSPGLAPPVSLAAAVTASE